MKCPCATQLFVTRCFVVGKRNARWQSLFAGKIESKARREFERPTFTRMNLEHLARYWKRERNTVEKQESRRINLTARSPVTISSSRFTFREKAAADPRCYFMPKFWPSDRILDSLARPGVPLNQMILKKRRVQTRRQIREHRSKRFTVRNKRNSYPK